jgi:hypothetical protein
MCRLLLRVFSRAFITICMGFYREIKAALSHLDHGQQNGFKHSGKKRMLVENHIRGVLMKLLSRKQNVLASFRPLDFMKTNYLLRQMLPVRMQMLFNFYEMQMRAERGAALVNMNNEFNSLVTVSRAAKRVFCRAANASFTNRHVFVCNKNFFPLAH